MGKYKNAKGAKGAKVMQKLPPSSILIKMRMPYKKMQKYPPKYSVTFPSPVTFAVSQLSFSSHFCIIPHWETFAF